MKPLTPDQLNELNARFEKATPQEILTWAITTYRGRIGLSSSFGAESAGLLHMATRIDPSLPILFLNTGLLFKETLQFRDELKKKLNLNIREFKATSEQIAAVQKKLADPSNVKGACCDDTKVALMQASLNGLDAWIAGLRRNQSSTRKSIKIVESYRTGLVKVHPLANWTSKELYNYLVANDLPFHPLWHKGFTSIGCEPCTSLPLTGQGDRSGRWAGTDKTECGIHTFMADDKIDKS